MVFTGTVLWLNPYANKHTTTTILPTPQYSNISLQYPPGAFYVAVPLNRNYTQKFTTSNYGNGSYAASASTYGHPVYYLFDRNPVGEPGDKIWYNLNSGKYSTDRANNYMYTAGAYTTVVSGNTIAGEWVDINMPQPIVLTQYAITGRPDGSCGQTPGAWTIAGSNVGSTAWTLVTNQAYNSGYTSSSMAGTTLTFNLPANTLAFNDYRLIIQNVSGVFNTDYNSFTSLAEWGLFGYQYPPSAVTSITQSATTTSNMLLSFPLVSTASSYSIISNPAPTSGGYQIATASGYTFSNLAPGTAYTFTITSSNTFGLGGSTTTAAFTTSAPVVYALDTLSQTVKNNLCGVWSLKTAFTGSVGYPVIQLKTSATGSTYTDFYGNTSGTQLTTASGQSLSAWLTANSISTAYVNTWYDQSYYVNGGYANGGTASNATVAGSAGVTLNTSTTPWSVDGSSGGYFNLPNGTVVGNGTCSISCKINLSTSTATAHAMIAAAQNNVGYDRNTLAYTYSGGTYTFINDWGQNNTNSLSLSIPTAPLIMTMITYVQGSTQGTYYTGGTSSTNYTQLLYLNKTTTSSQSRSSWGFAPGNDMLMNAPWSGPGGAPLLSQMFYCVNSSYAISDSDRNIIENS